MVDKTTKTKHRWEEMARGDLLDDSFQEFLNVQKGLHAFAVSAKGERILYYSATFCRRRQTRLPRAHIARSRRSSTPH